MIDNDSLAYGLYEQVISEGLSRQLAAAEKNGSLIETQSIDPAEAPKIISEYVARVVERSLEGIDAEEGASSLQSQVELANRIVKIADAAFENDENEIESPAQQLSSVVNSENTIFALDPRRTLPRPDTSVARSSLFTGASREPQMFAELRKEIASADRVDLLVSFIKFSGLRLILPDLARFTERGGKLRVITTTYMGATDAKAIERLSQLDNTSIKISYNTKSTRLHAKAYVFYRKSGFSTAYVGSSNLSNAAISSGLEWNVKLTQQDLPETLDKINATFEGYWASADFEAYEPGQVVRLVHALNREHLSGNKLAAYSFDIHPYAFQQEILDKLEAERVVRGNCRNLVVAATGTGKTVISAFDYKRYCNNENQGRPARLLFVAHRKEILEQSIQCFRGVMHDENFGELFVGSYRPQESLDQLFVSIQTFNSQDLTKKTSPDFFDFIVIDEFHHAAAASYQKLLSYYQPHVLLGLTATPERMDGRDILSYFDGHIAAEIRLPEAIDRKLLCPFQYFGVSDSVDLREVRWTQGGYDTAELTNLFTYEELTAKRRVRTILESLDTYLTDPHAVRGLGFCVSKEHARFMANEFNAAGIPSIALTSDDGRELRSHAVDRLRNSSGRDKLNFIFVVDLYNEGVDIPEVDTVLFLRPTQSLTVFIQQLGRGLRLSEGKECLTVLDYVGQANRHYNFEEKIAALLDGTRNSVYQEVRNGFTHVPKGCYIHLEKKAQEYILENISKSYGDRSWLVSHLASFTQDTQQETTLPNFLSFYHLDVRAIYRRGSFSRLLVDAGQREDFSEPDEEVLTKALARICSIDSRRWIDYLLQVLPADSEVDPDDGNALHERMLKMFEITIWPRCFDDGLFATNSEWLSRLRRNPVLLDEILGLLKYRYRCIDFVDKPVDVGFPDCPLDLHCQYSRDQIFVALDYLRPSVIRQGVKWLEDKKIDVLLNTLNKADKDYSPTTMYNDYSINEWLFHWQSQSTTSATARTGQRYIHHQERGSKVLLFVREFKNDLAGAAPFTFLGTANYVRHEGSRPMNIIWKLDEPIPARFIKKTNKLVAG
ncbi:MAG: DUF3427 domain-containing protein [Eggerthellaceae bacterium]|jgi:superfamily II DNA or RNA helicase/HKD family nuclease